MEALRMRLNQYKDSGRWSGKTKNLSPGHTFPILAYPAYFTILYIVYIYLYSPLWLCLLPLPSVFGFSFANASLVEPFEYVCILNLARLWLSPDPAMAYYIIDWIFVREFNKICKFFWQSAFNWKLMMLE